MRCSAIRPRQSLKLLGVALLAFGPFHAAPAIAHEIGGLPAIVIDTDVGLDDVVTLAMALQNARTDIVAIVACEGVAGRETSVRHLERLLDLFNRREIPLYAPVSAQPPKQPPPFRPFAERAVHFALPEETTPLHRSFAPTAYITEGEKTVVLALGPLTNLAAALTEQPRIKQGVARIIVAGSPDANGWNMRFDPEALATVQASGIPLAFVVPGSTGRKPESWQNGPLAIGQGASLGETFINRLLADDAVRKHYVEQFGSFHDELVFLYYVDSTRFLSDGERNVFAPSNRQTVEHLFTQLVSYGRQHKARVVFTEGPLPDDILQSDVRERKARILAKNGPDEWFAQLLVNELHEHLGAYSTLGVKMGLRAAELLNAPQHAMKVESHMPARPPYSCLNDGVIVATGSTPGRALFSHIPDPSGAMKVTFRYNGRRVTLGLKEEYRRRIKAEFEALQEKSTPANHEYWPGVRRLGLDIWENWHRRDLFEEVDTPIEKRP